MRHGNMMLDLHFVHNSPNKICKFRCPPPQRRSALAWFSRKLFFLSTKNMRDMCMAHNQKTWRKNNFWDFFKSVAYLYNINLIGGWRINKDIQYIKLLQILPKWFILQLGGRRNAYVQQTEYTPYSNQKKTYGRSKGKWRFFRDGEQRKFSKFTYNNRILKRGWWFP